MDQLLRTYQRGVASVILAIGCWLIVLYAPINEIPLGVEVFRAGILTVCVGSAAVLNWMGGIDAVLLYTKKRRRHPGRLGLCLRVVLHAYGSLALLMLFWRIFGYFTDSFASSKALLLVSRLHLVLLVPLYCYLEDGGRPKRWRRKFLKSLLA